MASRLLSLYSVDRDLLKSILGSSDEELFERIVVSNRNRSWFKDDDKEAMEEGFTPARELVRQMIFGESFDDPDSDYRQLVLAFHLIVRFLAQANHIGYTDRMYRIKNYCQLDSVGCFDVEDALPLLAFVAPENLSELEQILIDEPNSEDYDKANEFVPVIRDAKENGNYVFLVAG